MRISPEVIELEDLSYEKRVIDCKWLYMMEDDTTDAAEKIFKARWVVKCFEQQKPSIALRFFH